MELICCINEEQHLIEFVRNYSKFYDFSRTKGNRGSKIVDGEKKNLEILNRIADSSSQRFIKLGKFKNV